MNNRAKNFDQDSEKEVFISTQVMLQRTNRPLLPHEWLKLLGIMNEIQRAKMNKTGPNSVQVSSMSKPLINNLIRRGYSIYTIETNSRDHLKWFEVKW